jgi:hypothetical protein
MARISNPAEAAAATFTFPFSWLDASARASTHVQQLMQQMQQAQAQTLTAMGHDAGTAIDEAEAATRPQDVVGVQMAFAAEEYARMAQASLRVLAGLLDAQTQWMKEAEASLGQLLSITLDGNAPWSAVAKAWLDGIGHDLQASTQANEGPLPASLDAGDTPAPRHERPSRRRVRPH